MSIATLRTLALFAPLLATIALWLRRTPDRRRVGAIALACLWNLASLLALHELATAAGWWRFEAEGGTLAGLPVDLYLGWVLLWGALPHLACPRAPLALVVATLALLDLVAMPRFAPLVVLERGWLVGEALALGTCLLPSLWLARWTLERRRLECRALLQVAAFGALAFFWLPTVAFEAAGGGFDALARRSARELWIGVQLLFVLLVPGFSAIQELVRRGGGTPFPLDPPTRLVTSGPYAFVANPMQLSIALALPVWGWMLDAPSVALCGVSAFAFGLGFASIIERAELDARFPERWRAWRRGVGDWLPRWRPPGSGERAFAEAMPVLYVAEGCAPCRALGSWLRGRAPRGLCIRPAGQHPRRELRRITYEPGDGTREEQGVRAFGRALEHLHLGWALVGFALRLPGVAALAQLLVDAVGFGPRSSTEFGRNSSGEGGFLAPLPPHGPDPRSSCNYTPGAATGARASRSSASSSASSR